MYWINLFILIVLGMIEVIYLYRLAFGIANTVIWLTKEQYFVVEHRTFENYSTIDGEITWAYIIYILERFVSAGSLSVYADCF